MTAPRLIEIRPDTHGVDIDLVYASDRNFTGKAIYRRAHCLLLEPAEAALRRAVSIARQANLRLRIYDAYRPPQAQQILWDFLPDPNFVADLGRGSNHSRGTAVDLTLVAADGAPDGEPLDMGTGFDDMVAASGQFHEGLPPSVQRNRLLLIGIMHAAGFAHIASEWWHYELPGSSALPVIDNEASGAWRLM